MLGRFLGELARVGFPRPALGVAWNATAAVAPEAIEAPRSAQPVFREEQMLL